MPDRFFLYDMSGDGFQVFPTVELRDAAAKAAIDGCLEEDGWLEDVLSITVGEITGTAIKTNIERRPDRLNESSEDEDGNYWPPHIEEKCNVEVRPVSPQFRPDWNLLEATQASLCEQMAITKAAQESERAFREQVAAALEELRAEWLGEQIAEPQSVEESGINARIQRYVNDLDATIAALGLGGIGEREEII